MSVNEAGLPVGWPVMLRGVDLAATFVHAGLHFGRPIGRHIMSIRSSHSLVRLRWLFAAAAVLLSLQATAPAEAATAAHGNDVSWPQCGQSLPSGQAFAIVGVNNGLANTTNPCLGAELSWAQTSTGGTGQPKVGLYVNTANPGTAGSWWPTGNTYGGATVANPYGQCTSGSVGPACSYMYGYAKAYDDATARGVSNPDSYTWWLDVETGNSWSTDTAANRADLEGMIAYFTSIGATTGLYSTGTQWARVAGTVPASSSLYTQHSWLAGGNSLTAARRMCSTAPLTGGGKVTLTQYPAAGFDADYSCI